MAERCKAAEGQVVGPVEATILSWVLHAVGPVALALDIVGDLTPPAHVLLLGLLVLHDLIVHPIEFNGFIFLLLFGLLNEVVKLAIPGRCLRAIFMSIEEAGHLLLLLGRVVYGLLRAHVQVGPAR